MAFDFIPPYSEEAEEEEERPTQPTSRESYNLVARTPTVILSEIRQTESNRVTEMTNYRKTNELVKHRSQDVQKSLVEHEYGALLKATEVWQRLTHKESLLRQKFSDVRITLV